MACYQILTQSSESTVVAEYIPEKRNAEAYQSEADLEREFIALLKLQVMNICLFTPKPI